MFQVKNRKLRTYRKDHSPSHMVNFFLSQIAILLLLVFLNIFYLKVFYPKKTQLSPKTLGISDENVPVLTPTSFPTPTPTMEFVGNELNFAPIPTTEERDEPVKIAIIGDSMVDTMGERLEYLEKSLKKRFERVRFELYNYGKGCQNAEDGMERFKNSFSYQDRNYPSVFDIHPDIIIVGSFAYNPFSPYDRDRHWLALTHLLEEAKKITDNVYVLAEIAPLKESFGIGPHGVNWEKDTSYEHVRHIIEQLENAVGLSKTLKIPIINVYQQSVTNSQKEGRKEYVNTDDGIHPSVKGHEFMADMIASTIELR